MKLGLGREETNISKRIKKMRRSRMNVTNFFSLKILTHVRKSLGNHYYTINVMGHSL